MKHLLWIFVLATELAFAKTKIVCQSELLKRSSTENWGQAIFYDADSFEITFVSEKKAKLLDGSMFDGTECDVTSTKITCTKKLGERAGTWSINRISGSYEFYLSTRPESKVRGICSLETRKAF